MMTPGRVVLADDHPVFLFGLSAALAREGFEIVGKAADGQEAFQVVLREQPDLLVTDVRMPKLSGLVVCRQLRGGGWMGPILFLTTYDTPGMVQRARHAGATAFVAKDAPVSVLANVIRRSISEAGFEYFPKTDGPELTKREAEVLEGVARGWTIPEVATRLGIASTTAKDYLGSVYEKLGAKDRVNAVTEARRLGLLDEAT